MSVASKTLRNDCNEQTVSKTNTISISNTVKIYLYSYYINLNRMWTSVIQLLPSQHFLFCLRDRKPLMHTHTIVRYMNCMLQADTVLLSFITLLLCLRHDNGLAMWWMGLLKNIHIRYDTSTQRHRQNSFHFRTLFRSLKRNSSSMPWIVQRIPMKDPSGGEQYWTTLSRAPILWWYLKKKRRLLILFMMKWQN